MDIEKVNKYHSKHYSINPVDLFGDWLTDGMYVFHHTRPTTVSTTSHQGFKQVNSC